MPITQRTVAAAECDHPNCHVTRYAEEPGKAQGLHIEVVEVTDSGDETHTLFVCRLQHVGPAVKYIVERASVRDEDEPLDDGEVDDGEDADESEDDDADGADDEIAATNGVAAATPA